MNRLIYKSLVAIGLMGVAYYLSNPKKYNSMAKSAKKNAGKHLQRTS